MKRRYGLHSENEKAIIKMREQRSALKTQELTSNQQLDVKNPLTQTNESRVPTGLAHQPDEHTDRTDNKKLVGNLERPNSASTNDLQKSTQGVG